MAFDETLAGRIRKALGRRSGYAERKMFGGLCVTLAGNMCVGVVGRELMVRVAVSDHERMLKEPGARVMDFTGRPMKGFLFVAPSATKTPAGLKKWLDRCVKYCRTLPPKA